LKIAKSLRPRTGALRGNLVRPAIVGNFGIRVKLVKSVVTSAATSY
jgi:hypothetical protein